MSFSQVSGFINTIKGFHLTHSTFEGESIAFIADLLDDTDVWPATNLKMLFIMQLDIFLDASCPPGLGHTTPWDELAQNLNI